MKIMVIDGNSIINRAFYGVRLLTNAEGLNTNAIYGFLSIYFRLIEDESPDGVCVAFDMRAPTFRHKEYEAYKANRKGMPNELAEQMPYLKEILDAMNVMRIECEGYEADDIIGTISKSCEACGDECLIVTGDRDSFQLIENRGTTVLLTSTRMGRSETVRYNGAALFEKYGLSPDLMRDLKALMGDSSDNIPGVSGVGEKTALELVSKFGDIDAIYENIDSPEIRESVRKKLVAGKESAYLSKWLGTIACSAPIEFSPDAAKIRDFDNDALYKLFSKLELRAFIKKLNLSPSEDMPQKNEDSPRPEPTVIKDSHALSSLLERVLEEHSSVVLAEELEGVGIAFPDAVFALCRADFSNDEYMDFLRVLFSAEAEKTLNDYKNTKTLLKKEGIECKNVSFDTALGAYMLDPTRKRYDIASVFHMFGEELDVHCQALSDASAFSPLTGCERGHAALAKCASALLCTSAEMKKRLSSLNMDKLYFETELPLVDTLCDMEKVGIRVDSEGLSRFGEELSAHIFKLEEEIYAVAGEKFNILSPKQLGEILFEKLGIPPVKKTKTGYSTDVEVLEKIRHRHAIVPLIIDYRKYTKLRSTYAEGLLRCISQADGRIHTTFQQMVTATGRISSTEPNLQNIPIRSELGGEVRRMFVPRDSSYCFIDADYSQIELRVLAHITKDAEMCRAFKENLDIHSITASQVFGVAEKDVTSEMRRIAKAVNFGIVYGISEFSLAEDIGVTRAEAKRYMDAYLDHYSGVRDYMKRIVEKAREDGFVTTMFSRRRNIPEISSKNYNIRSFGERVALNAPIQGTAADIIKMAMVNIHRRLEPYGDRAELVLQVHDELIVEAERSIASEIAAIVTEEMQSACEMSVPLIAEAGIGDTWYDAKK